VIQARNDAEQNPGALERSRRRMWPRHDRRMRARQWMSGEGLEAGPNGNRSRATRKLVEEMNRGKLTTLRKDYGRGYHIALEKKSVEEISSRVN